MIWGGHSRRRCRLSTSALVAALALLLALPAAAGAQGQNTPGAIPQPVIGGELPEKPEGYLLRARQAIRIADRDPKVIETAKRYGRLKTYAEAKPAATWQIGYFKDDREVCTGTLASGTP